VIEIHLSSRKIAVIDESDVDRVAVCKWSAQWNGDAWYAVGYPFGVKNKRRYLHRYLLDAQRGELVDHVNRNTLDCRRSNLRMCNTFESNRNRRASRVNKQSRFKGVGWRPDRQHWRVYIKHNGRSIYLGSSKSEEDAARLYDRGAIAIHGQFAVLNFNNPISIESN